MSATPSYNKFVEQAKKLNPRYLVMIIPSRWFAYGKGLDEFRNEILQDRRVRKIFGVHPTFVMSINAWGCFCELGYIESNSLGRQPPKDTDKKAQMQAYVRAIADLLHKATVPAQVKTLADIEMVLRGHILKHVAPEIGIFLSKLAVAPQPDAPATLPASADN